MQHCSLCLHPALCYEAKISCVKGNFVDGNGKGCKAHVEYFSINPGLPSCFLSLAEHLLVYGSIDSRRT